MRALNQPLTTDQIKLIRNEYAHDHFVNPNLLWEIVKMKVRKESIKCGAAKKKRITREQEKIEKSIDTLEKDLSSTSVDDSQKQRKNG